MIVPYSVFICYFTLIASAVIEIIDYKNTVVQGSIMQICSVQSSWHKRVCPLLLSEGQSMSFGDSCV